MANEKGWYSKEEVVASGLPFYNPLAKDWSDQPYPFAVLLTKTRCTRLGVPILESGREKPSAFLQFTPFGRGGQNAGSDNNWFIPLYDRTDAYRVIVPR